MRYAILIGLAWLSIASVYAAPTLFLDAMHFDNHNFGVVDFEGSQSSVTGVNNYLAGFDAALGQFNGSFFGTGSIGNPVSGFAAPISGSNYLGGGSSPGTNFIIEFNTPVKSVGAFLSGWISNAGDPRFGNTPGGIFEITSASGAVTAFNPIALIGNSLNNFNGFIGATDEDGISKIQFYWNRDFAGIDNIYFGNNTTPTGVNGPTNVPLSQASTFPLPSLNSSENFSGQAIPEPSNILLMGVAVGLLLYRRK